MDKGKIEREQVLERGEIILNNHKFVVEPIYLMEEQSYFDDVPFSPYPKKKDEEYSDKELSQFAIALFIAGSNDEDEKKKKNFIQRVFGKIRKKVKKDYTYYSDNPRILGLVKWIEKKVSYKGRKVRFYDLERKYKLNKSEIVRLFGFLQELSGF